MNKRTENALRIRDVALIRLRSKGSQEKLQGSLNGSVLSWKGEGLLLVHRTPFQKLPPVREAVKYQAAKLERRPENLGYGLDIWEKPGIGKVLNIEWDDAGTVDLVSFRHGDWEKKVLGWSAS